MVDLFAKLAKPRLIDLLKLKVRHVYETTPGTVNSGLSVDGCEVPPSPENPCVPLPAMVVMVPPDTLRIRSLLYLWAGMPGRS